MRQLTKRQLDSMLNNYQKITSKYIDMWKEIQGKLVREYKFDNFITAMKFINQVAEICNAENHHPEIFNVYSKVKISFCTHDLHNKITAKDRLLCQLIDSL